MSCTHLLLSTRVRILLYILEVQLCNVCQILGALIMHTAQAFSMEVQIWNFSVH